MLDQCWGWSIPEQLDISLGFILLLQTEYLYQSSWGGNPDRVVCNQCVTEIPMNDILSLSLSNTDPLGRFPPVSSPQDVTLYWIRTNSGGSDNAAIQSTGLDTDYRYRLQLCFDHPPELGCSWSWSWTGAIYNLSADFLYSLTDQNIFYSKLSLHFKYQISNCNK